jgi:hypothetical protein
MAYNNFTLPEVTERFELTLTGSPFCADLPVAVPSELFSAIFQEWFPLAQQARSEKAKSELLISPVLLEVRKLVHNSVELFSGEEFSVDRELGLNGFCDFLLSKSTTPYIIQAPVVMLVEAKRGELDLGLGQCIAEMLDRLRPLPPELVDNLREVYDIRLTYHSNAIEGNTLTQSETQIVVEKGITIGGKPLKDHLEAINHVEAIVAWQSGGDDTQLKETIAKCVESSLVEILSLAGEA